MLNWIDRSATLRSILLAATLAGGGSMIATPQNDVDAPLVCKQGESVIYTSEQSDIAAFNASDYGAVLVQVIPITDANLNLYIFNPGQIICAIKADLDTSGNAP